MKRFLRRLIEAVLRQCMNGADAPASGAVISAEEQKRTRRVRLATRLGVVSVSVRRGPPCPGLGTLLARYSAHEQQVLAIVGRMVWRARASREAAQMLAEVICGRPVRATEVEALHDRLREELNELLRQDDIRRLLEAEPPAPSRAMVTSRHER
jgi:7-keto-8-aminopelargonate synthetase-like enzyme